MVQCAHHLDVVDTRTAKGSTVRFYDAAGFEIMTLKSDDVSTQFDSLFGDSTREEPVGLLPFADVQVGPADVTVTLIAPFAELVTATRAYSESEADWLL